MGETKKKGSEAERGTHGLTRHVLGSLYCEFVVMKDRGRKSLRRWPLISLCFHRTSRKYI